MLFIRIRWPWLVVTTSSAHDIINLVSGQEASKTIGAPVDVDVNAVIGCHVCCQLCTSRGMQCRSVQTVVCRHPVWTLRVQKCQQVRHPTCSDQSLNRGTEFEHKRILGHITTVFAHNNTVLHKMNKYAQNHTHLRKTIEFQQTVQLPTHFLKGSYSTEECYIWGSESIPLMDCTHRRLCRHSLRWWTCGRGRWSCR